MCSVHHGFLGFRLKYQYRHQTEIAQKGIGIISNKTFWYSPSLAKGQDGQSRQQHFLAAYQSGCLCPPQSPFLSFLRKSLKHLLKDRYGRHWRAGVCTNRTEDCRCRNILYGTEFVLVMCETHSPVARLLPG